MAPSFSFGFPELLVASRLAEACRDEPWTFEFAASLRSDRAPFLIAAGLPQAIELLEGIALAETDLALLRAEPGPGKVDPSLDEPKLARVAALRFSGDVHAVPEGTVVFAGEPLLRLRAPAPEAVAMAAALLATMRVQTAVATRVARMRLAAGGKPLFECAAGWFGRDTAILATRAAHVGGSMATSNPLGAATWNVPALPVIPLSLLIAIGGHLDGIERCAIEVDTAQRDCEDATLDRLTAPPRALVVDLTRPEARSRIESLRSRLDARGWSDVALFGGGAIDEIQIEAFAGATSPIGGFCVGASLFALDQGATPVVQCELVERTIDGRRTPVARRDGGAGPRAVWRRREVGRFKGDTIQPESRPPPRGSMPLLVPVMQRGKRLFTTPSLAEVRVLSESQLSMLDPETTRAERPAIYPVTLVADEPLAEVAEPPQRRIDLIDDQPDFTMVQDAFAEVANRLVPSPSDALPEAAVEPSEQESPAEPAEPVEADLRMPPIDPLAAAEIDGDDLLVDDESPTEDSPPPAPVNPLLLAAARLRSIQRGDPLPASPAASSPVATARESDAPRAAAVEPVPEAPSSLSPPSDPLLAAAARLKSLRRS